MTKAVIAGYVRSPFTPAFKGRMATVRPDELAAQTIKALVKQTNVNADDIDDLILGCAFPEGEQGLNMARLCIFLAELPISVAGATLNRFCGSSMQSVHFAAGNIAAGMGEAYIAAGVESMSRVPMTGFNPLPHPGLFETYPEAYEAMGITAENVAKKYKISRKDQEQFAVESHQKAAEARGKGNLEDEIVPIYHDNDVTDEDECIRPETTLEALAGLRPAFEAKGVVTAGTSSPLTDGAAAVLVCSEDYAKKNKLDIMARIKSFAVAGCAPEIMGIGPVSATKKALERADLTIEDIDIIELNEAFSSQALACISDLNIDPAKVNLDGGAIALGHPLGATGARITGKVASLLKREGKRYGLSTQCIGGGQGIATILEAV